MKSSLHPVRAEQLLRRSLHTLDALVIEGLSRASEARGSFCLNRSAYPISQIDAKAQEKGSALTMLVELATFDHAYIYQQQ